VREYIVTPHTAAGALTRVTTGTALKTLLQVNVPANAAINILGWGVSFRGVAAADPPGECYLMHGDVAASAGTSFTPESWRSQIETVASACIGGAALTGHSFGTEGTITASVVLDPQQVHPQSGYGVWFPTDCRPRVGSTSARFVRIRSNFTVAQDAVPWIVWDE
jgi:hypothetical protein